MQYNLGVAYLLWLLSGFGIGGFHRFYLGKVASGALWLCTGGLFFIGAITDFFRLPALVHEANIRASVEAAMARGLGGFGPGASPVEARVKESPEKTILRVAHENGGAVTPGEVALKGDMSIAEAQKELEKLAAAGNAEMRVRSSGVVVYFFPEFAAEGKNDYAL
ncbi:MAG: TM2 domain-containing protein [Rectinemataceae bacterium]